MVAGAELGYDAPHVAVQLRVLSDIFLRLIRTIVAPLILATLIVGIAGHGDLKGVGRMGLKALVYFEVVTTLALAVGLVAINVSKAGVGLTVSGAAPMVAAPVATRWDEVLLHVFPENLAKSIAEGQVLQVVVFAVLFGIIEYSRMLQIQHTVRQAALEGARAGIALDAQTSDVQTAVTSITGIIGIVSPCPSIRSRTRAISGCVCGEKPQ